MGLIGNSNLRFIRSEEGDRTENFMTHIIMTGENYQKRYRSNSRDRRIQFSGQSRGRPRYEQIIGEEILEVT